jgi:hypothetical protein
VKRPTVGQIAEILLRDWDPIGVADTGEAPESEYLHEAAELAEMLSVGASPRSP